MSTYVNIYNETKKPDRSYYILKISQIEYMLGKIKDGDVLDRKRELTILSKAKLENKLIKLLNSIKQDTPIKNVKSAALLLNPKENEPKIFE